MRIMNGGQVTYGFKIGILMLDTTFPRPIGDMGNALTWPYPVLYKVVKGAYVKKVVKEGDKALIPLFIEAALELQASGVKAITTNCGFIALFQKEIQEVLSVPFLSSNLMQIPLVYSMFGEKGVIGVLTASKSTLTQRHFEGVNAEHVPLAVEGMDDSEEFNKTIIQGEEVMDLDKMEYEISEQAKKIVTNHKDVRAIVLECTNLTPYLEAIKKAVNVPVFDVVSLVNRLAYSLND